MSIMTGDRRGMAHQTLPAFSSMIMMGKPPDSAGFAITIMKRSPLDRDRDGFRHHSAYTTAPDHEPSSRIHPLPRAADHSVMRFDLTVPEHLEAVLVGVERQVAIIHQLA